LTTRELLRDKLAPAIGRVILKYALGADAPTLAGPFLDWLSAQFKSRDEARQAERFARDIANRVVDGLVPVFDSEHSPDLNPEAVALALGETLDRHFDGKVLVAHDLDPERLIEATLELRPLTELKRQRYATSDIALYERALPELIQALVPRAKEFSDFEVMSTGEVLNRLRRLAETQEATYAEARGTHAGVRRIETWLVGSAQAGDEKARAFEIDYLRHLENNLDDVQLVGITADPAARRQRLSKAYIPLSLSGELTTAGIGGPVYFETLLETLTPTRNRLLVVGAAGSGKTTLLRWAAIRVAWTLRRLNELYADGLASWSKEIVPRQHDPAAGLSAAGKYLAAFQRSFLMRQLDEGNAADLTPSLLKLGDTWLKAGTAANETFALFTTERVANSWWLRVPFLIPLRLGPAGSLPDLQEYPKLATNYPMPPPDGWVESVLQAGRALLLIDGIDEIPRADRPQIQAALEGLSALPAGNYVVFTTRPDVVGGDWFSGQELLRAEVSPLSATDRDQLIDHWHTAAADQLALLKRPDDATPLAAILRDKLRRLPEIAQLATNPLLCASICALHYSEHGYLPKGQADLCDKLCEMLLERRDRDRKVPSASDREGYGRLTYAQKQVIVQTIAQDMIRAGEASIEAERGDQLIDGKRNGLGVPADLTTEVIRVTLAERSGLLREAYGGALDFMHNTLRDYLAGTAFAQDGQIGELVRNVQDQSWRKPIVFAAAAGKGQYAQKLVAKLLGSYLREPDAAFERALRRSTRMRLLVAALCEPLVTDLGNLRTALQEVRRALMPPQSLEEAEAMASLGEEIVSLISYEGDRANIARACVRLLRLIGSEHARQMLRAYIDDRRPEVAEELAFAFNPLELSYWQTMVRELSVLWPAIKALPDAIASQVTDLAPLENMTNARELYLDGVAAVHLKPLAGIAGLLILSLDNTNVADLRPLHGLTSLQKLYLSNTLVGDLTPLAGLTRLQELHLDNTAVADLDALAGLTRLRELHLQNTAIRELRPLGGLFGLRTLVLNGTKVVNLTPLRDLTALEVLWLNDTAVADLTPLRDWRGLQHLYLDRTEVVDLTPLAGLTSLRALSIEDTAVADLTPVQGIQGLRIYGP
jgi:hypothetical protein